MFDVGTIEDAAIKRQGENQPARVSLAFANDFPSDADAQETDKNRLPPVIHILNVFANP